MPAQRIQRPLDDASDDALAALRHLNGKPANAWFAVNRLSSIARGAPQLAAMGFAVEMRVTGNCVNLRRVDRAGRGS